MLHVSGAVARLLVPALFLTALGASAAFARSSPLDGSIRVVNNRHAGIVVSVDGVELQHVPGKQERVLRAIPHGVRYVTYHSRRESPRVVELAVPRKGQALLRVGPRRGRAEIVNRSKVALSIEIDGQHLATLSPGRRHETRPLTFGEHRLVARPTTGWASGGRPLRQTFTVKPGAGLQRVRIDRYLAGLTVHNPTNHRAAVILDGERVRKLAPGERVTLGQLVPGKHSLALRQRGRVLAEATFELRPGASKRWSPEVTRRTGSIQVTNTTRFAMRVKLDGHRLGRIEAGATRVFGNIPTGGHSLTARSGKHGHRFERHVVVRDRGVERLALGRPARAAAR